jgi:hypothetical protein
MDDAKGNPYLTFYLFLGGQILIYVSLLAFLFYNSCKYIFVSKTGIVKSNAIRLFYVVMGSCLIVRLT